MARTKQTCRKSTGGSAPRRQLAATSAKSLRSFLVGQQSSGREKKKRIFINYENTLSSFRFQRKEVRGEFQPEAVLARIRDPCLSSSRPAENLFLRLDFNSELDGNLSTANRPALEIVFVLDVSGSMKSSFPDDSDGQSKLDVAKSCIRKIVENLTSRDTVAVVSFNTCTKVVCGIENATDSNKEKLSATLSALNAEGGTELAVGVSAGYELLRKCHKNRSISSDPSRQRRVIFLTDMDSDLADEEEVLSIAEREAQIELKPEEETAARKGRKRHQENSTTSVSDPIFVTVVGMGVDLSMSTVDRLSRITGAKYVSVMNAAEFMTSVANEFAYDVTPIAFDINVQFSDHFAILQAVGSSELNSLKQMSAKAHLACEFASPMDDQRCCLGGIYLFKLAFTERNEIVADSEQTGSSKRRRGSKVTFSNPSEKSSEEPHVMITWLDRFWKPQSCKIALNVPGALTPEIHASEGCDEGLRKAAALVEYVNCLTSYAFEDSADSHDSDDDDDDDSDSNGAAPSKGDNGVDLVSEILSVPKEVLLPKNVSAAVLKHYQTASTFHRLKQFLTSELQSCGDDSLHSYNSSILQTISQIEKIECGAVKMGLHDASARPHSSFPRGIVCPITLSVMSDPVIAADGYSYERAAIVKWIETATKSNLPCRSPSTNLTLSSNTLHPNISLKMTIQDYKEGKLASVSSSGASSSNQSSGVTEQAVAGPRRGRKRRGVN